jgi:hypothetical protein
MFRTATRLAVVAVPKLFAGAYQSSISTTTKRCFVFGTPLKMATASDGKDWKNAGSIYEFQAKDIDGNDVSMEKYKGYVVIIVNTACK